MDTPTKTTLLWTLFVIIQTALGQEVACPAQEAILPCICTNRNEDLQIWCTHSDLSLVLKGIQKLGDYITKPVDELIIENNYLPSLPGKMFQNVKILRLMLRHNGLERLSLAWLETQEINLLEIFIVENDLKSLPGESLNKLQNLQALTIQSHSLKRLPTLSNMQKLRYINIESNSLNIIQERTFENLPNLERLYIKGSTNLRTLKENALYNLAKLKKLEITDCGVNLIHMRALSLLPSLNELSLANNKITDATMVGRAIRDLPMLSILNLNFNFIDKLAEGAFVEQPLLERIYISNNNISVIHYGAFHRVPKLKVVELNYNKINRIHPESFLQESGSGVEELTLIGNLITHISEFRALLDALPRLRFLDMSENMLEEIPRGALRGHPSLERLHLNKNNIKYVQVDAFVAMPALRELHLRNNSLTDMNEGPFWNLPALKGLDISENYFRRLQPKMLYNIPALRRINFSHNRLTMIDPITFMELPLLEYVNISNNELVSIHPATFRNLEKLYEIDASSNRLIEFIPGLPRGLEQLFLQKNQITSLPVTPSPDLDLPYLRTLDISSNGIERILPKTMTSLPSLRRLYMSRNGLKQIDVTTFSDLEKLEVLDLGDNQIISVHPQSFSKLRHLKKVNLHGNTIDNFDFMSIQENAALSTIDFSKNKLKSISPSVVKRALDVEIFNISLNNLNELPATLNMLPKLKILDASFNHIKNFDGNIFNGIKTLTKIKMPHNRLIELRTGSFTEVEDLETIDLDNNRIEIIHPRAISNLPKLVSVYLSTNHIVDIPDKVFSNLPKLKILEMQGNRLQFISPRAFDNTPLLQYLNVSNNHLTNIESSGLRQLTSVEVLDLSLNKLTKISTTTFQYMEWLVELNLDNNQICYIGGKPFDFMPRLKVLSMRNNKLTTVSENSFVKLRSNIAILDFSGNPLVCNCKIIWLKAWLSESSAMGPKCADGTYIKGMPFSKSDCLNFPVTEDDSSACSETHENQALLPNLSTSQVFSTLDKIKDYATHIRNTYHNTNNKISNKPSPEESEYFYDEYVDYPYNETIIDGLKTEINLPQSNKSQDLQNNSPIISSGKLNMTSGNKKTIKPVSNDAPAGGFTFFGMPLPAIDMTKLLNTGRKVDSNSPNTKKYQEQDHPKFETGGFSPILPTTASGFKPIPGPNVTNYFVSDQMHTNYSNSGIIVQNIEATSTKPPINTMQNNTTHQKTVSEIHELQAYLDDDNSTHVAYNKTTNIEEEKSDPVNKSKYNLMESNLTITQVTEKDGLLITTDTTNDMSLQIWAESSTMSYASSSVTEKPVMKKEINSQPTALSAVLVPSIEELAKRNPSKRPATITKVQLPLIEHYDLRDNYSPVINREGKTRFSEFSNSRTREADGKEWYYKNYNKTSLEPYVAPDIETQPSNSFRCKINNIVVIVLVTICKI